MLMPNFNIFIPRLSPPLLHHRSPYKFLWMIFYIFHTNFTHNFIYISKVYPFFIHEISSHVHFTKILQMRIIHLLLAAFFVVPSVSEGKGFWHWAQKRWREHFGSSDTTSESSQQVIPATPVHRHVPRQQIGYELDSRAYNILEQSTLSKKSKQEPRNTALKQALSVFRACLTSYTPDKQQRLVEEMQYYVKYGRLLELLRGKKDKGCTEVISAFFAPNNKLKPPPKWN